MKRDRTFLLVIFLTVAALAYGQPSATSTADVPSTGEKRKLETSVNFGAKGGFTASLFLVSDLSINGQRIDQIQNNYKIGYFASMFMRINFDRHFLQPELSYTINRCNITFDKPLPTDISGDIPADTPTDPPATAPSDPGSITSSIHSVEFPVIYGYNLIKEGPYSLAVFAGPKLRFIWDKKSKVTFENFNMDNIHEELYPFNVSLTLGVAVTISRIFFDFRYDIGLHNISRKITYDMPDLQPSPGENRPDREIRFTRKDNVLSFSFGVFF